MNKLGLKHLIEDLEPIVKNDIRVHGLQAALSEVVALGNLRAYYKLYDVLNDEHIDAIQKYILDEWDVINREHKWLRK